MRYTIDERLDGNEMGKVKYHKGDIIDIDGIQWVYIGLEADDKHLLINPRKNSFFCKTLTDDELMVELL